MSSAMQMLFTIALTIVVQCQAQFYFHQPLNSIQYSVPLPQQHYQYAQPPAQAPAQQYAHPSVVANSETESQLGPELSKSDRFYKNPRIAAALAKESWFTDKEMPVIDREAEKIPRDQVYKLFKNAGWIKRR